MFKNDNIISFVIIDILNKLYLLVPNYKITHKNIFTMLNVNKRLLLLFEVDSSASQIYKHTIQTMYT